MTDRILEDFLRSTLDIAEGDRLPEGASDHQREVFGLMANGMNQVRAAMLLHEKNLTFAGFANARSAMEHAMFAQESALLEGGRERIAALWETVSVNQDVNIARDLARDYGIEFSGKIVSPRMEFGRLINVAQASTPIVMNGPDETPVERYKFAFNMTDYTSLSQSVHPSEISAYIYEGNLIVDESRRRLLIPVAAQSAALLRGAWLWVLDDIKPWLDFGSYAWDAGLVVSMFDPHTPRIKMVRKHPDTDEWTPWPFPE